MTDLDQDKTDIKVKLIPRSSRNRILGKSGDAYKVKVTSPPVDGKANKALVDLLAKRLKIPKSSIEIVSGKSSRVKYIRIHGISPEDTAQQMDAG